MASVADRKPKAKAPKLVPHPFSVYSEDAYAPETRARIVALYGPFRGVSLVPAPVIRLPKRGGAR